MLYLGSEGNVQATCRAEHKAILNVANLLECIILAIGYDIKQSDGEVLGM